MRVGSSFASGRRRRDRDYPGFAVIPRRSARLQRGEDRAYYFPSIGPCPCIAEDGSVKAAARRNLKDGVPVRYARGTTMDRVVEQAEFLKDVCKLVVYATELGYTVTGDAMTSAQFTPASRSSTPNPRGAACGIDLHFFRRDRGAFTPAQEPCSLRPLVAFWESLSPHNRCVGASTAERPRFERRG
jgi:hypothetical protein